MAKEQQTDWEKAASILVFAERQTAKSREYTRPDNGFCMAVCNKQLKTYKSGTNDFIVDTEFAALVDATHNWQLY